MSDADHLILSERFEEALAFAARLHVDQRRKGSGVPYVGHLLTVAGLVLEYGGSEDEAIAALLHDAIEDQGGVATEQRIVERFGPAVAAIVRGCTDADTVPKPPWTDRKRAYIAHLEEAGASVRLVSCCDKIHNARAIYRDYRLCGESVWERFTGGREGSLWYYGALADTFLRLGPAAPAAELDEVVLALEKRAGVRRGESVPPG